MIMDIDFSGHRQHLHHIVAKDHVNKVVVLAIRGTFSIRDLIVDANAFTRKYYICYWSRGRVEKARSQL